MSSARPPDPWQSQPTPEDEVYEPEPDDDDTGPLQVHTPPPDDDWDSGRDRDYSPARELPAAVPRLARGDGAWPSYFDTPLVVNPRSVRRDRKPLVVAGAVALVIVVVGALAFWLLRPSSDTSNSASTNPATTTLVSPSPDADVDDVAQGRLTSLLPPGYPSGACTPVAVPKDAPARLTCEKNSDPGGPVSSTYTLVRDKAALRGAFDAIVGASTVVNCPGNIQSGTVASQRHPGQDQWRALLRRQGWPPGGRMDR